MVTTIKAIVRAINALLSWVFHTKAISAAFMAILVAGANMSAKGARYYVDGNVGSDGNSGASWGSLLAFESIAAAIDVASSGDEIWVADDTYYPDEGTGQSDNARTSTFLIPADVEIYGGFIGTESDLPDRDVLGNPPCVFSGDIHQAGGLSGNAFHVVSAGATGNRRVDGVTIRHGATK